MSAIYSIKNSYLGLKIFSFKNSKHEKKTTTTKINIANMIKWGDYYGM